jgi:hypothetical protein
MNFDEPFASDKPELLSRLSLSIAAFAILLSVWYAVIQFTHWLQAFSEGQIIILLLSNMGILGISLLIYFSKNNRHTPDNQYLRAKYDRQSMNQYIENNNHQLLQLNQPLDKILVNKKLPYYLIREQIKDSNSPPLPLESPNQHFAE